MNYNNLTKLPIAIISTVRSGSTALMFDIYNHVTQNVHNLVVLNEPRIISPLYDKSTGAFEEQEFLEALKTKNLLLKIHAHDCYPKNIIEHFKSMNFYMIRIRRRNILEQGVSFYISRKTKVWINNEDSTEVPIDMPLVYQTLIQLKAFNRASDNFNCEFDQDIFYEDCKFLTEKAKKNVKVKNYNEIYNLFKSMGLNSGL